MKTKKNNAELVWKQLDDQLVPRLRLGPIDRAAYCHLLRHTRLEGKLQLRFSATWRGHGICLGPDAVRCALHRLIDRQVLRLLERSNTGHLAKVRLPQEILADRPPRIASPDQPEDFKSRRTQPSLVVSLEQEDFLRTVPLRHAIHAREAGRCFYCQRLTTPQMRCLDHVIPRARSGDNSYRNLVSCCRDCNMQKGQSRADDFLRSLFSERKLTDRELAAPSAPSTPSPPAPPSAAHRSAHQLST